MRTRRDRICSTASVNPSTPGPRLLGSVCYDHPLTLGTEGNVFDGGLGLQRKYEASNAKLRAGGQAARVRAKNTKRVGSGLDVKRQFGEVGAIEAHIASEQAIGLNKGMRADDEVTSTVGKQNVKEDVRIYGSSRQYLRLSSHA